MRIWFAAGRSQTFLVSAFSDCLSSVQHRDSSTVSHCRQVESQPQSGLGAPWRPHMRRSSEATRGAAAGHLLQGGLSLPRELRGALGRYGAAAAALQGGHLALRQLEPALELLPCFLQLAPLSGCRRDVGCPALVGSPPGRQLLLQCGQRGPALLLRLQPQEFRRRS